MKVGVGDAASRGVMRLTIAAKLALVVVPLVLVPSAGIGYLLYSNTRVALEASLQEELEARLHQVGLGLRPFLRERELDLYDIASVPAIIDYHTQVEFRLFHEAEVSLQKLSEHLERFVQRRQDIVAEVRYLDQRGRELVSATPQAVRRSGADHSRAPYFLRALRPRDGTGHAVSVERSETLSMDVLRLSLPVHNQWEELRGVVVLDVPIAYLTGTLADALAGRQGTTFLAGADGAILGPPDAEGALRRVWVGPEDLGAVLRTGPQSARLVHLRDGGRALLVREAVGSTGWSVGILASVADTEARVTALTRSALKYGSGAVLLLVLAVAVVAQASSRRVRRLQEATAQLAHGRFALRLPAGSTDELGDLSRSFNTLAESLARRDVEVRARTEEAQQRRRELEVLNTVIHAAQTSLDLRESLEAILDSLLPLFGFATGAIRLLDEPSNTFVLAAHRGLRPGYAVNPPIIHPGEGGIGRALSSGQPVVFTDPAELALYRERVPEGQEIGGMVFVPILAKGQALGAVVLATSRTLGFTEAELNLLGTIGLEVGAFIENARLFSQTQALLAEAERHRAHAEALAEIGRAVTATLDRDRVLDLVAERVGKAMVTDAVSILRIEGGVLRCIRAHGFSSLAAQMEVPVGQTPIGAAALCRAPVWTADLPRDPRFADSAETLALFEREGIRAVLAAPIIVKDDVWGVLSTGSRQPHDFGPEEIRFAAAVAQQAAIAIENAGLYANLQSAYAQVKAAQEQAIQREKLGALGQMAGGVAHDFNNLLAAILGRAELLQRRTTDPVVTKGLRVIQQAALDGAETVRRILGFARAKGEEQEEAVEMGPLLRQVVEIARPRWKDESQARGVLIDVQMAVEPGPPIRGNPVELREVFLNLLFNAVDAMPAGGTITLGVTHQGPSGEATCFIRDTGVGMPDHVRRRAFDPFFTTKGVKGTGLGLSVVYGIVSRHNGRIEIESGEGLGTTVAVHLPVFQGPRAVPVRPPAPAPAASGARILVVDDEARIAEMLAETLRLEGDHTVEVITNPRAAVDRLRAGGADVLFTDLGMPELSGWELAAQARALHPGLPVILVTGWGHQLDPEQVQQSGIHGVVAKPFCIDDIRRPLASALARSRQLATA